MKKIQWFSMLVMAMVFCFAGNVFAQAGNGVITTGAKTGNYIKVGYKLKGLVPHTSVVTSKGSVDNIIRIIKDEASVGIVQMDAYAYQATKDPVTEEKVEIMGPLYEECVYIAVNVNGRVTNEDDLQTVKGAKIAVGKTGSGTAVTWDYMRQLEPAYKNASTIFKGGNRMLGKLAIGGKNAPDAVMWTTKPGLDGKLAQSVLKNKNLAFIDVNDKDLNDKYEATGEPIYRFKNIKSSGGFLGGSVKTICTDAVLVGNADADEEMLERLSDLILNYKTSLVD